MELSQIHLQWDAKINVAIIPILEIHHQIYVLHCALQIQIITLKVENVHQLAQGITLQTGKQTELAS